MRSLFISLLGLIFIFGCARVMVQTPKDPIKVDISMRLDIYQHIEKDIEDIESIVSGAKSGETANDKQSLLENIIPSAYAQGELSPDVEGAAYRRRDRKADIVSLQAKGIIGENKLGLLEIRDKNSADAAVKDLVKAENSDRMVIYQALANKNNTSLEEVEKMYAKRLQEDAPKATAIEQLNEATGAYEWKIK